MTTHVKPLVVEPMVTGKGHLRIDRTLLQSEEGLCDFEGRARRIGATDGPIEEGASGVAHQLLMMLSAVASHHGAGVVSGRRGHTEDFARGRFDGHNRPEFAFEQTFGELLCFEVDAEGEIAPGTSFAVERSIFISPLRATVDVAKHDAHSFLPAQHLFIGAFHPKFADEVAAAVVAVAVDIGLRHFAHIAQNVRSDALGVAPHRAFFGREASEAEQFFLEHRKLSRRDLTHEELRRVARITHILFGVFDFGHACDVLLASDAHRPAEVEGVHPALILHGDEDVVGRFVVDEQCAVAVGDESARGIDDFFSEGVGVGTFPIVVAHELEGEKAHNIDKNDGYCHRSYYIFSLFKTIIFGHTD